MYALDGEQFPLTDAEANHLLALAPRLKGCLPLSEAARTAEDLALIEQLHEQGAVFDLPIAGDQFRRACFATISTPGSRVGALTSSPICGPGATSSRVARPALDTYKAFSSRTITTSTPRLSGKALS